MIRYKFISFPSGPNMLTAFFTDTQYSVTVISYLYAYTSAMNFKTTGWLKFFKDWNICVIGIKYHIAFI